MRPPIAVGRIDHRQVKRLVRQRPHIRHAVHVQRQTLCHAAILSGAHFGHIRVSRPRVIPAPRRRAKEKRRRPRIPRKASGVHRSGLSLSNFRLPATLPATLPAILPATLPAQISASKKFPRVCKHPLVRFPEGPNGPHDRGGGVRRRQRSPNGDSARVTRSCIASCCA